MQGKIIKGIGGFYYVHDGIGKVYECRAKGIFRNRGIKPLVGDNVEISVLDEEKATSLMKMIDLLEDDDDVQNVYTNMEISDEVAAKLAG